MIASAPGCLGKISLQYKAMSVSPHTTEPFSSTTPIRSESPSKAKPTSAFSRFTVSMRETRFSRFRGSGWWLGKFPSGWQNRGTTRQPNPSKNFWIKSPAVPFPASATTLSFRGPNFIFDKSIWI